MEHLLQKLRLTVIRSHTSRVLALQADQVPLGLRDLDMSINRLIHAEPADHPLSLYFLCPTLTTNTTAVLPAIATSLPDVESMSMTLNMTPFACPPTSSEESAISSVVVTTACSASDPRRCSPLWVLARSQRQHHHLFPLSCCEIRSVGMSTPNPSSDGGVRTVNVALASHVCRSSHPRALLCLSVRWGTRAATKTRDPRRRPTTSSDSPQCSLRSTHARPSQCSHQQKGTHNDNAW
ncbi:hypothetical protein C8Q80DRAFT_1160404 [Daedaleopsis nitida]|nr:hypothetical protein C8Q80DRAFT_1160404 [Daedaleopsis nitida]